jgi:hypothetical protein
MFKSRLVFDSDSSLVRPPLWTSDHSSWLQTQRSQIRLPTFPDILCRSGSGTGPPQPREHKSISYLKEKVAAPVWKTEIDNSGEFALATTRHPSIRKSRHSISTTSGGR